MAYVGTPRYLGTDRDTLASIIQGEAGNQGPQGMSAVAAVIQNRAAINFQNRGSTAVAQALSPMQFQGQSSRPSQAAYDAADSIISGRASDPTNGALYYANPGNSRGPLSTLNENNSMRIGDHYFSDRYGPASSDYLAGNNQAAQDRTQDFAQDRSDYAPYPQTGERVEGYSSVQGGPVDPDAPTYKTLPNGSTDLGGFDISKPDLPFGSGDASGNKSGLAGSGLPGSEGAMDGPFGLSGPNQFDPSKGVPGFAQNNVAPGSSSMGSFSTATGMPIAVTDISNAGEIAGSTISSGVTQAGQTIQSGVQTAGQAVQSGLNTASQTLDSDTGKITTAGTSWLNSIFEGGTDWLVRGALIAFAIVLLLGAFLFFMERADSGAKIVPIPV